MVVLARSTIYDAIDRERQRQREKWSAPHVWGQGDCSSPKVDETVKAAVLKRELIQVAAVAVAWLETYGATE